jgi:hypothetical protein
MDASARQANQSRVMSARDIIARAKQRSYEQNAQAIAALRGAGIQNVSGALDLLGGGAMMGIDSDTFAGGAKKTTDTFNAYTPTREEVLQSRQYAPMSMQYNPIIRRKP